MYVLSKDEINRQLGKNSWFKSRPKLSVSLNYVKGSRELDSHMQSGGASMQFQINTRSKGVVFFSKATPKPLAARYDELKHFKIHPLDSNTYALEIHPSVQPVVLFTFSKEDGAKVIPFFRALPIKEVGDLREEEEIVAAILALKENFSEFRVSSSSYSKSLPIVAKKSKTLDINEDRIVWGDESIATSETRGYAGGIDHTSSHGASMFTYSFVIMTKGKPFYISFSTSAFLEKRGTLEYEFNTIYGILFDVVSRKIVLEWLDDLIAGKTVEFKEFDLTRAGIILKTRKPSVLMHWDELVPQGSLIRWRYTNTVFLELDARYDRRIAILDYFIYWLQSDEGHLTALMGRLYA